MTHIPAGPDIAETAIMARLATLSPYGVSAWSSLPVGTLGGLLAGVDDVAHIRRAFVAQHQDAGGRPAPVIHSAGWRGLVTLKCLSADKALALDGRDRLVTAMGTLAAPTGYAIAARYSRPAPPLDDPDGIYHRGAIYEITVRRTG